MNRKAVLRIMYLQVKLPVHQFQLAPHIAKADFIVAPNETCILLGILYVKMQQPFFQ